MLKNRQLFINILLGVGLISAPFLSSPDLSTGIGILKLPPFQRSFLSYFFLLVFFYANYYIFVPKFYIKKKWGLLIFYLIISYLIIRFVPNLLIQDVHRLPFPDEGFPDKPNMIFTRTIFSKDHYVIQFIMVLILSLHLRINNYLTEVKNEQLQAEISYLKAQINPHFLFNTLNNIYALALKKAESTPMAVLKLSNIMRYVVTESDQKRVLVKNEIAYINDYIALQKMRLTNDVIIDFNIEGDPGQLKIAPMLLITFIENAFKYGVSQDQTSKITIFISFKGQNAFLFEVENTNYKTTVFNSNSSKAGLKNTQKRLAYAYPNSHQLKIIETLETYKIILNIKPEC